MYLSSGSFSIAITSSHGIVNPFYSNPDPLTCLSVCLPHFSRQQRTFVHPVASARSRRRQLHTVAVSVVAGGVPDVVQSHVRTRVWPLPWSAVPGSARPSGPAVARRSRGARRDGSWPRSWRSRGPNACGGRCSRQRWRRSGVVRSRCRRIDRRSRHVPQATATHQDSVDSQCELVCGTGVHRQHRSGTPTPAGLTATASAHRRADQLVRWRYRTQSEEPKTEGG